MAESNLASRPSLRQLRANLPPNVVILPTAAPRQVRQRYNRESHKARMALREGTAKRFSFKHPAIREAERRAKIMYEAGKSPALILALVMLQEMDRDTRAKVIGQLERGSHKGSARAALEFARTTAMPYGEQLDLIRAFEALGGMP